MERLLNEAISTVDAAEREKKQSRNKHRNRFCANFSNGKNVWRRKPLANDGSLGRPRRRTGLNETVKNLSKMSVHQKERTGEEELDELHR
jgi:hypothetical protein